MERDGPAVPEAPWAVAAVLIFSRDPGALADFYRRHFGLPMRPVQGGGLPFHLACDVGHVYVSIWPAGAGEGAPDGSSASGIALAVRDLEACHRRLVEGNVEVVFGPRRTGVGLLARYRDPDGNLVELVQPLPR
ncbi:VOC family protein [Myxococcota bacterium]|nr:VOC family protein [Myxococcota bacterium]